MKILVMLPLTIMALSCGDDEVNKRGENIDPFYDSGELIPEFRVRGRIVVNFSGGERNNHLGILGNKAVTQEMAISLAPNVKFEINNAEFVAPTDPAPELTSFGKLVVTKLIDNNLLTCGSTGTERCTGAVIQSYTTGTPDKGLWNAAQGYGLPITYNSKVIGLDAAGAVTLSKTNIAPKKNVLKLVDLSGAQTFDIPIDVDFSNAGAGNYATTLIIEYLVK